MSIFSANIEDKMRIVFQMTDYDQNALISAEDIKMILSYIPCVTQKNIESIEDVEMEDQSSY